MYSGTLRTTRCVCARVCTHMCMEVRGHAKTDPALVLQVCLGLGSGHLSPESPAAQAFLLSPLLPEAESRVWSFLLCFNTMGQIHWSIQGCLHLSRCSSLRHTPALPPPPPPPRSQRVLRIPGGSACPLGHWQGTPVLKQVTCRDPVWRGHLRRWPQLSWQRLSGTRRRAVRD